MVSKEAKRAINKVLKQHNCRLVLAQGSKDRYLIQRRRMVVNNWGGPVGAYYAIGIAYAYALEQVLCDATQAHAGYMTDGWYAGYAQSGDVYGGLVLDEREILQVKLALK